MGDSTVVRDPASGLTISMTEGMNGLGGVCAPGQAGLDESMTVWEGSMPGLHLASAPIGRRTPTLEREGMYFLYSVNMTGAKVNALELVKSGIEPSEYRRSELHRDVSGVLLSLGR